MLKNLVPTRLKQVYRKLHRPRYRGPFETIDQALAAARAGKGTTYDDPEIANVNVEFFKTRALWDYPVAVWIQNLRPATLFDYGGHVGAKYYALSGLLKDHPSRWIVYDVPAVVAAGRRMATENRVPIQFVDRPDEVESAEMVLFSGALQYVHEDFPTVIAGLRCRPQALIVNKLAVWDRPDAFVLEDFGIADIPYRINNRAKFLTDCEAAGFYVADEWEVGELTGYFRAYKDYESVTSVGYCLIAR